MSQRKTSSAISRTKPVAADGQGIGKAPRARPPYGADDAPNVRPRFLGLPRTGALLIGLIVFLLAGGAIWWLLLRSTAASVGGPATPTPAAGDWSQTPVSEDEHICARFVRLKNAGDPAAFDLLGPAPAMPDGPLTLDQADRLETEYFLRQDVRFTGAGRDPRTGALVLYAKGNVSAPTLRVTTGEGAENVQRTMSNPDLTVEVRDGRIYGVAAGLHHGP
jgi:hypothetical protein